jgi:sarcosine oxidase, subunit delta
MCPYCGVRDEEEFCYGGESHTVRPGQDVSDSKWSDYLFNRNNVKGLQQERWCHSYGCGQWFNVARDTVTHDIRAVYPMSENAPMVCALSGQRPET